MTTTLVAVAQSAKARFFRHQPGSKTPFKPIAELEHPKAALHDGDILTDSHGQVRSSNGTPGGQYSSETSPTDLEAERFAKEVAEMITRARLSNEYDQAVVLAAPAFLGRVRADLSAADERFVAAELAKNLTEHDDDALAKYVDEMLNN